MDPGHRLTHTARVYLDPPPLPFPYFVQTMEYEIQALKAAGADGIVLGVLDAAGNVDVGRLRPLLSLARPCVAHTICALHTLALLLATFFCGSVSSVHDLLCCLCPSSMCLCPSSMQQAMCMWAA